MVIFFQHNFSIVYWPLLLLVSSSLLRYIMISLLVTCLFFLVALRHSFSFRFFTVSLRCAWYGYIFLCCVWFSLWYINLKSLIFINSGKNSQLFSFLLLPFFHSTSFILPPFPPICTFSFYFLCLLICLSYLKNVLTVS